MNGKKILKFLLSILCCCPCLNAMEDKKITINQNQINQNQFQEHSYFEEIDNKYNFLASFEQVPNNVQDLNKAVIFSQSEIQKMLNEKDRNNGTNENNIANNENNLCPPKLAPIFERFTENSYKTVVMIYQLDKNSELVTSYFGNTKIDQYFVYKFLSEHKPQPSEYTEVPSSVDSLLRIANEDPLTLTDDEAKNIGIKPSNCDIVMDCLSKTTEKELKNHYAGTMLLIKSNKNTSADLTNVRIKKLALQMFINSCEKLDKFEEYREFVVSELIEILLFRCLCNAINSAKRNNDKVSKAELLSRFDYVFADVRNAFCSVIMPSDDKSFKELLYDIKDFIPKDEFSEYENSLSKLWKQNLKEKGSEKKKQSVKEAKGYQSVWNKLKSYLPISTRFYSEGFDVNYIKRQFTKCLCEEYRWITVIDTTANTQGIV